MDDSAILMARKDYKVQSFDRTLSSIRWSISFSEIHHLDTTSVNDQNAVMEYLHSEQGSLSYSSYGPSLTTGEDNSLHAKDPATGWNMWSVSFTSPPVVAFPLNGAGRSILAWDAYLSDGSSSATAELWRKKDSRKNSKVLVGTFSSGGHYALPVPSQTSAASSSDSGQGLLCCLEGHIPEHAFATGTNPGDKEMLEFFDGQEAGEMGQLDALKCVVLEVTDSSEQDKPFPWLPEASKKTVISLSK